MGTNGIGRRAFLAGIGATTAVAVTAGCLGDDADSTADDPVVDIAETTEGDTDPEAWADVSSIRFDGYVGGWVGRDPAPIELVENPTLVLLEGREYDLTWENQDGMHHNIAFWDADREVVDNYTTDGTDVEGERETLTFEATAEMATYRCEYQQEGQRGDVTVLKSAALE
ncbi:cupredoxin domain-containing protein [Natronolimnobius baerhuensis]|uniref:Blue (type 1) copper domain-containing protein n=1 Tax=Natronolimnobius baerhuensis TaxID=253108 RepID=A0A202E5L1_9EURY|nr:hypothetical protein [Natronolimnobius baerhuensis]OVE83562.1 hypothetical protein B2G88_14070 [Natronolimnobius baerhuensis]